MHEQLAALPRLLTAHLELSLFALLVGIAISVPLGVLASRSRSLERVVMSLAGGLQTVPGLALLALMVPALGALGVRNIGFLPAFVALVLYSIFPILKNTVVGLATVDPALIEAARAVGMNTREQLVRVELPVALPVIAAGIRTATVWTVGAATLATPVGADSLGNYIFGGLQTRNSQAVLVGCIASALLALSLDGLAKALLDGPRRTGRRRWLVSLGLCLTLFVFAGVSLALKSRADSSVVTIGAKTFTEQYILSEALALQIRRVTGVEAIARKSLGSSVAFDALRTGAIDAYVDYAGTIWTTVMKRSDTELPKAAMLANIDDYLRSEYGIRVVATLGFENGYSLVMPRDKSETLHIVRISDLAQLAARLTIAGDYEFFARPEWRTIVDRYHLQFRAEHPMASSLMYQAAATGAVDVIAAFSTDGRIAASDLVALEDDKRVIPPYDALVLAGRRLVETRPEIVRVLRALDGRIDTGKMRQMNLAVTERRGSPAEIAQSLVLEWASSAQRAPSNGN